MTANNNPTTNIYGDTKPITLQQINRAIIVLVNGARLNAYDSRVNDAGLTKGEILVGLRDRGSNKLGVNFLRVVKEHFLFTTVSTFRSSKAHRDRR